MDGKIDEIREALNELQGLIHHIERTTGHEYDSRKLHAAFKALSTIDPDAIRRECAYKAKQAILSAPYDNPTRAYAAALAEEAILSAEPARGYGKPEVGDVVAWRNSRGETVVAQYGEEITQGDAIILMRSTEVRRRIEEAKE